MAAVSETQGLLVSALSEHIEDVWVWEDLGVTVSCLIRGNNALAGSYYL